MREIIFRGKDVNSNEWRIGYFYTAVQGCVAIIGDGVDGYQVKHETVGQYTGLKDKNGTKIFEGDIVKGCSEYFGNCSFGNIAAVLYDGGQFLFVFGNSIEECAEFEDIEVSGAWCGDVEVIGNVFDNPELLEVKQ